MPPLPFANGATRAALYWHSSYDPATCQQRAQPVLTHKRSRTRSAARELLSADYRGSYGLFWRLRADCNMPGRVLIVVAASV